MHFRAWFRTSSRKIDNALLSVFDGQQSLIMQELEDETPETKLIADKTQQSLVSLAANRIRLQGRRTILSNSFIKKNKVGLCCIQHLVEDSFNEEPRCRF